MRENRVRKVCRAVQVKIIPDSDRVRVLCDGKHAGDVKIRRPWKEHPGSLIFITPDRKECEIIDGLSDTSRIEYAVRLVVPELHSRELWDCRMSIKRIIISKILREARTVLEILEVQES